MPAKLAAVIILIVWAVLFIGLGVCIGNIIWG